MPIRPTPKPRPGVPSRSTPAPRTGALASARPAQVTSPTFADYKAHCGELTQPEFDKVLAHSWSQPEYEQAFRALRLVETLPAQEDVAMAAKLIGALGDRVPRDNDQTSPHPRWLLIEARFLQGKFAESRAADLAMLDKLLG